MSNLAHKEVFVPRANLQRTLKYHSHLKLVYKLNLALSIFLGLVCAVSIVLGLFVGSSSDTMSTMLTSSIAVLILYLQTRYMIRPAAFSNFTVFPDRLEIEYRGKTTVLHYKDIQKIKFTYISQVGGGFKIVTAQRSYSFTAVLERSEYILESILSYDRNLVSAEQLEAYRRTAIIVDHSWAFYHIRFRNRKVLVAKYAIEPLLATAVVSAVEYLKFHAFSFRDLLLFAAITVLSRYFISGAAFAIIARKHAKSRLAAIDKNPNFLKRDLPYEHQLIGKSEKYQKIAFIAAMAALSCAILLFKK